METLPLSKDSTDADDDAEPLQHGRAANDLACIFAFGAFAECSTSVCCPLVWRQELDVTGTALNLLGPLLLGAAHGLDEETGTPDVHRACAAFQAGFVGVLTSFSFMVDQASVLAAAAPAAPPPPLEAAEATVAADAAVAAAAAGSSSSSRLFRGWAYICGTMATGGALFVAGRLLLGAALRVRAIRRVLVLPLQRQRFRRRLPVVRWLVVLVVLLWVWVLLAPPGAVFRPLEVHEARASAGLPVPDLPPGMASKATDVAHLACGMAMQSAGLAVSMRIDRLLGGRGGGGLLWGPLACNLLACAILLAVRVGETAAAFGEHAFLATKLRTSGCGALSVSGGLAALLLGSGGGGGPPPEGSTRRHGLAAGLNFGAHAAVAAATCALLPWLAADR